MRAAGFCRHLLPQATLAAWMAGRSGVAGRKGRDVRGDVLEGFPIGSEKGELCVN